MTAITFVGVWLAAYRLTRLIVDDWILNRPREWWFLRFPPDAEHAALVRRELGDGTVYWQRGDITEGRKVSPWGVLFDCWFCAGLWVSGIVVELVNVFHAVPLPVLWWWAVSGAVGLTGKNLDG